MKITSVIVVLFVVNVGPAFEPLVWISSNLHSVVTLFILVTASCYLFFLETHRRLFALLSFLFFILALGTKEVAVVLPILLFFIFLFKILSKKPIQHSLSHFIYAAAIVIIWIIYGIQQYIWQREGFTIAEGYWELHVSKLFRLPILLLDLLFPLSRIIDEGNAVLILIISSALFLFLIFRFYKSKVFLLGLAWSAISLMPTIFFISENWWDVLASRYTYLPRIGIALLLCAIFIGVEKKQAVRRFFLVFFILLMSYYTYNWVTIVKDEYPYVYRTGDTLQRALVDLAQTDVEKVYVSPDRPFESNQAHIVGAIESIAEIQEKDIVFLEDKKSITDGKNTAVLYWDFTTDAYKYDYSN